MDLKLKNKQFIVCGSTSGFGLAIAEQLITEKANIIAIARNNKDLLELEQRYPDQVITLKGDITKSDTISKLHDLINIDSISGIVVNAGGPPAKSFIETKLEDWDIAYDQLLRWKVELTKSFLPVFKKLKNGRFVYIESSAVKQPIENLVLSTSLRLAVVGFVKTLSQELADSGVTFNILAPGYHETKAVERLIKKKSETENISYGQAKHELEKNIPIGKTGDPSDFASLALWLLSPMSGYVTGQLFAVDGAVIKSTL